MSHLCSRMIKDTKEEPTSPPPPLSALPGGFLKQLVRETEKETKLKEPEVKEEKAPSKLSDNLVQQFLLPDQTPPILEAEMALRNELLVNGERGRHSNQSDMKTSSPRRILSPDLKSPPQGETPGPQKQDLTSGKLKQKQEVTSELLKRGQIARSGKEKVPNDAKKPRMDEKKDNQKEGKNEGVIEPRQEPEGKPADTAIAEHETKEVRDVWYEVGTVWYVHKEGYCLATQLKPDEGTPDLPAGLVRLRMETDGTLHDVMEHDIQKINPSELDLCEDLSDLQSVNECSVLYTLTSRAKASLPLTHAGPNLLNFWPPLNQQGKVSTHRTVFGPGFVWDAPPALAALVRRVYISMVGTRRDQSVCAVGRSGTGKTTSCQAFTHTLLKQAGTAGDSVSVERIQAVFTILRSFGCVSSHHSDASSRFAMVFSLDFNHAGLVCAGHLQVHTHTQKVLPVMEVYSFMTELQMNQLPEANSFGIVAPTKVEEKQRASVAFTKLLVAMETLGISANEQRAIWHVLAGIFHLGAAGSCKVGRRAFVSFDRAQVASSVLGCDGEELQTAVFKYAHTHTHTLSSSPCVCTPNLFISLSLSFSVTLSVSLCLCLSPGPRLTATQCVDGMASGLYEELFTAVVSLINRALSSQQLTLASVMVVDTPGFRNPRHSGEERAATWSELCHNYLQERLLDHFYTHTFTHTLDRYTQERVPVDFEPPESSPAEVVSAIDKPALQVRGAEGDPRGLLWVLDEEMVTPGSTEHVVLERVCQYYVRQCEQPLQCEVSHLMGSDPVRYDLTGWFSLVQNNPSALNAISLLQNSSALFGPRASVPPLCRGLGGVEGGSQRSLQRSGIVRKTFSGGMAAIRRHSHCISVKLQADALMNVIRRAKPVFLQCVGAKTESSGGGFDIPALRVQLHSTHILPALQLYRTGFPEHMPLSDFRCRFQALSPLVMKRYGSVFSTPDERKAVEELLVELDLDKKSIFLGASRMFTKRGVLKYLEQERDKLVSGWLVQLQASCMGHLARQQYRKMKVQQMAVRCIQNNIRALRGVAKWSWWKLLCRLRPLLDVNMDDQRLRAKEDEIIALRRRLEKSERERNELRQSTDILETKVTAISSELSDERFRGEAVSQALDIERGERLRLTRENKELQVESQQLSITETVLEMALQLECCQTEVEFVRRRVKQTEERLEAERQTRLELDVASLQAQLEQSKKSTTELKRQVRRVTSDLQDARVLTDSLQGRAHELDRKQRRCVFDSELTQALEEADRERELKDKAIHESTVLRSEIYSLKRTLQVHSAHGNQAELVHVQQQKEELCAQIRDLSVPFDLASDSLPDLKKQLRLLETQTNERGEEITKLTTQIQQAQQLRQLEMQLEQEYEEKQMVVHEKNDLEGLIATLCDQVGHRDFDVEKRLRRDLKRTHALLVDAQLLLSTIDHPGHSQAPGSNEHIEHLHCQLEESEARRAEVESVQKTLSMELENTQIELENICKLKSLLDEQVGQLQHEKSDLLKRLEEDQEDLNELMKKHKALIAQSSSDISQIRELQTELEEVKKERHRLQEELTASVARVQFLESSTVGRSIVSMQEARVCDLENKLEFQRGQVKRFEVLVLRLRDSVVRLGEELEQCAQTEARERENSQYYQQRLQDMRLEVEDLVQREQDSSRRCMELVTHTHLYTHALHTHARRQTHTLHRDNKIAAKDTQSVVEAVVNLA
uniref:Myosin motor domain-containing protein n=1 Tax=Esox lucius TaxID=8010 RepID=A0AAY5L358_ESOLU